MRRAILQPAVCCLILALCAPAAAGGDPGQPPARIELPLLTGWFEGQDVQYISTDMSDPVMAAKAGVNYAPRLAHALRKPQPGQPSAVDRVYKFPGAEQGSVFASAPQPVGAHSRSSAYSPLWVVYMVQWNRDSTPQLLRSEEEVLAAEEQKRVTITPTTIIVNCPIVYSARDGILGGAQVR